MTLHAIGQVDRSIEVIMFFTIIIVFVLVFFHFGHFDKDFGFFNASDNTSGIVSLWKYAVQTQNDIYK